eukprot:2778718-Rhodomonas_salina.1
MQERGREREREREGEEGRGTGAMTAARMMAEAMPLNNSQKPYQNARPCAESKIGPNLASSSLSPSVFYLFFVAFCLAKVG